MKLTTLGKEQLEYTGKRLNQMNIQFDRLIHSGMVRAYESAIIINEKLDSKLQLIEDKNLTEGLPVAPIPYAGISQRDIDVRKTKRNLVFYVKKKLLLGVW
jgi:broad specificity phosphatase PhoE